MTNNTISNQCPHVEKPLSDSGAPPAKKASFDQVLDCVIQELMTSTHLMSKVVKTRATLMQILSDLEETENLKCLSIKNQALPEDIYNVGSISVEAAQMRYFGGDTYLDFLKKHLNPVKVVLENGRYFIYTRKVSEVELAAIKDGNNKQHETRALFESESTAIQQELQGYNGHMNIDITSSNNDIRMLTKLLNWMKQISYTIILPFDTGR